MNETDSYIIRQFVFASAITLGVIGSACSFNSVEESKSISYAESSSRAVCEVTLAEDGKSVARASIADPQTLKLLYVFTPLNENRLHRKDDPPDLQYVGKARVMESFIPAYSFKERKDENGVPILKNGLPTFIPLRGLFEVVIKDSTPLTCLVDKESYPVANQDWVMNQPKWDYEG